MKLSEYLALPDALSVADLRSQIGARSDAQIRQWQHGYAKRKPGPAYCLAIETATGGAVTRRDLRPGDWHRIWPDLAMKAEA
jgi:DNA-binding transcriptional regulator YdaS (Cro superfamily)